MSNRIRIRLLAAMLVVAAPIHLSTSVMAQEKFPSRPIELIIPAPVGGGTDLSMRFLVNLVEPLLGTKIAVINRGGAGGVPGIVAVKNAKPDGYVLAAWTFGQTVIQPQTMSVPYTPDDATPIALSSYTPIIYCARRDFPANNGRELLALFRANPDKYNYGSDGIGTVVHLTAERIFAKVGAKARAIPFAGAGDTLKSFLGGHIDIYGGSTSPIAPYVKSGEAKCLLVASGEPIPGFPQATTVAELGFPEAETRQWRGIVGPKGMDPARVSFLEKVFGEAAKMPEFKKFLEARGEVLMIGDAKAFKAQIDKDYREIGVVVKQLGLKAK